MLSQVFIIVLAGGWAAALANEPDEGELPVVKLQPQIRIIEGDYAQLPCAQLHTAKPESATARAHLAKRKQQCLHRYRQFFPGKDLR